MDGTDRRLQRYGVKIGVRAGAVPIDIYTTTTTTTHTCLYYEVADRFMRGALRLKY